MAAISKTVSKAGYAKLQEELEYLITVKDVKSLRSLKKHVLSETFPRMLSTTRLRTSRLSLNQRSMS